MSELTFTFSRSSGPGGQNVNKVNSKATMTWNIKSSPSCSTSVKDRFSRKYSRFISGDFVIIHSQKFRSQPQNIDDCISKLHKYLTLVEFAPKTRRATRPSKSSIKKRLDKKSKDSKTKKLRQEKF